MIRRSSLAAEARTAISTPTAWVLLGASMVMAAVSLLANLAVFDAEELPQADTITQAMHASTVATLMFALVAGIVSATSDVRFGRVDQLLLTDPRPSSLLAAKAVVGSALGVVYGLAGAVVTIVATRIYYGINDAGIELGSAQVVRPLVGAVIGAGLFCVMGVGFGHAVRNQPLAIGAGLALLLIVQPPALLGVPAVGKWLPGAAGLSLTLSPDPELIGQMAGGVLAVIWAVVALGFGAWRFHRRRAT